MNKIIHMTIISVLLSGLISCRNENEESFAYGNFEAEEIMVSSESNGIIREFYITEGQSLNEGDVIGYTDTLQLELKKKQLKAVKKGVLSGLDQLNSQIKVHEVNLNNLEREYRRFGSLFLEEAATKKQIDDIEGQMNMVKAQIDALNARKSSVYAEAESKSVQIEQINDQIKRSVIRSPIIGQVLETYTEKGEMAVPGIPVIKIANISNLILRVFISGNQLSSIKTGDMVDVLFDDKDGIRKTEGKLIWISPEAEFTPKVIQTREERVSLVYAAKISVPNDGSLKIGMPGEMQLKND